MSPKKRILRTLKDREAAGGLIRSVRPSAIPGFSEAPEKYQQTINALLKDRLIEGMKDSEGHLALSLPAPRARDVQRVLRPIWTHPALIAGATVSAAVVAAVVLM